MKVMIGIIQKCYFYITKPLIYSAILLCAECSLAHSTSHGQYIDNVLHIDIVIKNHQFEPNYIEVPTNQKIKLNISNLDDMLEEFESIDLKREKIIPPGKSVTIVLAPLKEGEYNFFGDFHQDTAKGILKVK